MTVHMNIAEAKAKLSELVAAAENGEEVILARSGRAVVRIVPVASRRFRIGMLDGMVEKIPDFLEPMSEEELRLWE